ncbi:MAG: hypothetical protein CR997_08705 [Acidobacteria bacterium]|nr:MAG: hypothetical protein CR997_08705 [Acidobacteriota bacterium]
MTDDIKWFVKKKEKLYGPFGLEKMKGFLEEGRVTGRTRVSRSKEGPLICISEDDLLKPFVVISTQKKSATPAQARPQTGSKPPAVRKKQPSVLTGRKVAPSSNTKKKKPNLKTILVFTVLIAALFAIPYFIINTKSKIVKTAVKKVQDSSPIREMLNKPELPTVWPMWKEALEFGLNFSEAEIRETHKEDIEFNLDIQSLGLPDSLVRQTASVLTYIQTGGFYHTYLIDQSGFTSAIAISHVHFERILQSLYNPKELGDSFEVKQVGNQIQWVSPVLDDFEGRLIWEPAQEDHRLACLLLMEKQGK